MKTYVTPNAMRRKNNGSDFRQSACRSEWHRHRHGARNDLRRRRSFAFMALPAIFIAFCASFGHLCAEAFRHNSCTFDVGKQFQFADCYLPDIADDLALSDASFLMSHDAATGYLKKTSGLVTNGATNLYTKTQIGDVYQQLDDGARALDVRPKLLANGTVVLHHGAVPIAVTLERLVEDARQWALDNPSELVLILHSNFAYASSSSNNDDDDVDNGGSEDSDDDFVPSADTTVEALSQVYANLGVNYVECSDLYGLTVGETKRLAALSSLTTDDDDNDNANDNSGNAYYNQDEGESWRGGYLLAMDRHDQYAGSCAKQNWVEDSLVTCYSSDGDVLPCTDRKSVQHKKLKEYALASANNKPTDNSNELGPPESTYYYPFNEIQALWQVDGISAALGVRHVSSIIDDNTKSHLNARVVDWIYDDEFDSINLLVADHVSLNGNALTSVLRNRCGQSELSYDQFHGDGQDAREYNHEYFDIPCGTAVGKPHLRKGKPLSTLSFFATALVCAVLGLWIAVFLAHYRKHHDHAKEIEILEKDLQIVIHRCGCSSAEAATMAVDDLDSMVGDGNSQEGKKTPLIFLPNID